MIPEAEGVDCGGKWGVCLGVINPAFAKCKRPRVAKRKKRRHT